MNPPIAGTFVSLLLCILNNEVINVVSKKIKLIRGNDGTNSQGNYSLEMKRLSRTTAFNLSMTKSSPGKL